MKHGLVIVGCSYAAAQLAASARDQGFKDPITIIGEEAYFPYQRPPLSKGLLTGKMQQQQLGLRSEAFYQEANIDIRLHQRVTSIDASSQTIKLRNGDQLNYDWLAITTGAKARQLNIPGHDLPEVTTIRTLDDALKIKSIMPEIKTACIIGGGFIGLEAAAALSTQGIKVTVIESNPQILSRSFPSVMADYIKAFHLSQGVNILCNTQITAINEKNAHVDSVTLQDGTTLACELVIVGIGVTPNTELAIQCGATIDPYNGGILTDGCGQTSVDNILAVGDVASVPVKYATPPYFPLRLESIQAANDGAKAAASLLMDAPTPNESVPWFWSDQFNLKFQMAGIYNADDEIVIRGDMTSNRFSIFYLKNGVISAVHSVNKPADHMLSRKLIQAEIRLSAHQIADENFDLKAALTAGINIA